MKTSLTILASILLAWTSASAQQPIHPDPLLDHMTGHWILQGTIAGREVTHDIDSDWVLNQEYVRIHETSREKNAQGQPVYEAIVFIERDDRTREYKCEWLDSTAGGGLSGPIAEGKRSGDAILFVFPSEDGSGTHTTFVWSRNTDTWQWVMDNEEGGKLTPFARVQLSRK
ncbi:MAG: hypothetical protein WA891_06295 [Acidobacteriaceae bacterium]